MAVELKKRTKRQVNRFALEPYSGKDSRHMCPSCKKLKSLARYIDITTGEYLEDNVGRCNRETSCGYHVPPKDSDFTGDLFVDSNRVKDKFIDTLDYANLIPQATVMESIVDMGNDNLSNFLMTIFPKEDVLEVLHLYGVGTSNHWAGSTVFWQIDQDYEVRTGKIMLYNEVNGKRVKEPFNYINWVHSLTKKDYSLKQCLFGEHLIHLNCDTYHVVESEKTAIVCRLANPRLCWIATGGLQNIRKELFEPFIDKKLIFYPDKGGALDIWAAKVLDKLGDFNTVISKALESKDLPDGADLADYIIGNHNKKD